MNATAKTGRDPGTFRSARTSVTTTKSAEYTNHRNCCRSSPEERRKRTMSDATAATTAVTVVRRPATRAGDEKSAFSIAETSYRRCHDAAIAATIATAMPIVATQPTQRQRGVGGCPSGKSRSGNVARRKTLTIHVHDAAHVASGPNGSEPGLVFIATVAYSWLDPFRIWNRPTT